MNLLDPHSLAELAVCAFFAVLFLQSSIDKITDRKGNLDYLMPHFEKSPLKATVPLLLSTITLVELSAGVMSGAGFLSILFTGPAWIPVVGIALAATALLMLFFGQRVAKDYPGAATLATYFAVVLLGLLILPPGR